MKRFLLFFVLILGFVSATFAQTGTVPEVDYSAMITTFAGFVGGVVLLTEGIKALFPKVMNLVLGGGLVATIIAIITLKSTVREARAKAEKATAEAETVRIDNTEHATRILIENIVEPLKEELNENRKALQATRREMARLRKAIDTANSCRHHDDCPVLYGMREYSKEQDGGEPEQQPVVKRRQRVKREAGVVDGGDSEIGGEPDDPSGQPP